MPELYSIRGPHGSEYHRARLAVANAIRELRRRDVDADRFASAILARLADLDPPMLVVSLLDEREQLLQDRPELREPQHEPDHLEQDGWGVWHADDGEWLGFSTDIGIVAEMVPEDYDHLQIYPVTVTIHPDTELLVRSIELATQAAEAPDDVGDAQMGSIEPIGIAPGGPTSPVGRAGGPEDAVGPKSVDRPALEDHEHHHDG